MAKTPEFFRYAPHDGQPGFNALVGDVVPDGIYRVPAHLVDRFVAHPDWEASTKGAFDKQQDQD